ncbi:hypothetical protein M2282_004953 [Variovorax boronicumulans]|uniref:hypothetical protein n=1 Tax=Variovorax boronicumulans TaxID=436515 RepID=UPI002474207A|nr:hypothetical protein [Variovorax boronicumulans]MDH6169784.1 hypothetical protein [Variovorax boronicumulans]
MDSLTALWGDFLVFAGVIFGILRKVPDVFWAALIAAALALWGVKVANRDNARHFMRQLRHDKDEKAAQRLADLRRDVYLHAIDQFVHASSYLSSLPIADLNKSDAAQPLQGFFAAAAKLQMVSEAKTSALVSDLIGTFSALHFKLIGAAQPIQQVLSEIDFYTTLCEGAVAEQKRALSAIDQFVPSGNAESDEARRRALDLALDTQTKFLRDHSEMRQALHVERHALHGEFVKSLMLGLQAINTKMQPIMVAIRRELNIDNQIDVYADAVSEQQDRVAGAVAELMAQLDDPRQAPPRTKPASLENR